MSVRGAVGAAIVFLAACSTGTAPPFGAVYRILLEPDAPQLSAGELAVTVSYGGCRAGHEFVLDHRMQADSAAIWLHKVTKDEPCDMLVTERRTFVPAQEVGSARTVVLLTPDGTAIRLRP